MTGCRCRRLVLGGVAVGLLGFAACPGDGERDAGSTDGPVRDARAPAPAFHDVTAARLPPLAATPFEGTRDAPEIMGPGLAAADLDGDGRVDLVALTPPADGEPRESGRVVPLWQREDGTFEAGDPLDAGGRPQAIALGDVDGDGRWDLGLGNVGTDRWFRNEGNRRFSTPTALGEGTWTAAAAFCDVDGDGDHDWIAIGYLDYDPSIECLGPSGQADYCAPDSFPGVADRIWRNHEGRLVPADVLDFGDPARVRRESKGLGMACADLTGDGRPDLYVANDRQPNHLWVAHGGGFREEGVLRGVAVNRFGRPEASMGVELADQDGDGRLDLFLTHLGGENNTFYRAAGRDWADATPDAGAAADDFPYTGFGCAWFDADLDGDRDLAVANGRVRRGPPIVGADRGAFWDRYVEPDRFYENVGDGRLVARGSLGALRVSRGLLAVDLDGDGDEDLAVSYVDGSIGLFENRSVASPASWKLTAVDGGAVALGARLEWRDGFGARTFAVASARGYQSAGDATVVAAASTEPPTSLLVIWTDGTRERFPWPEPDGDGIRRASRGDGTLEAEP